jgi:hypothetical protein
MPENDQSVQSKILATWVSIAAIAEMSGLHSRVIREVISRNAASWDVEYAEAWIDGHNRSHFVRKRKKAKTMMVMGVTFPVSDDEVKNG